MKRKYVIYAFIGHRSDVLHPIFGHNEKGEPFLTEEAAADYLAKRVSQWDSDDAAYTILPIYTKQ